MRRPDRMLAALLLVLCPLPAAAVEGWEETAADVLTGVVPLGAGGVTYLKDDPEGRRQWLWSTATSLVVNTAARVAFNETEYGERPNGHPYGFPSGHTSFIASGAAFLQERYGYRYGIPAWLMSGYTAYVRVETDHHRWRDVIAAAALSYGISRVFVTPFEPLPVTPVVDAGRVGLLFEYAW